MMALLLCTSSGTCILTNCLEQCVHTFLLLVWSGEYGCARLEWAAVDGLWQSQGYNAKERH